MDVVSTMITELGGAIELETLEEQGSCITLRVPSSLATTQGLILQVGTQRYGIILDLVERIVRTQLNALANIEGCEVLFLDKQPIAITSLAKILHLPELEPRHRAHAYPIVILRTGSQRMALIVDDIPGEMPMIVKPLGPQFENIKMYSGGAILSDGSVMPVLDAKQVITQIAGNARAGGSVQSALTQTDDGDDAPILETQLLTQRVILVVDDSITTRTLERSILEAAGYRVLVATDGEEAVDIMRIEDGIALVVTDLEMPRMNGLELCKHIRNGRHKHLPIIMVTSVGNETEMRKGLAAGADAYIVKGNFSQDHFLATVRRFVDA
jgi:CheY-like chemotaxis protein